MNPSIQSALAPQVAAGTSSAQRGIPGQSALFAVAAACKLPGLETSGEPIDPSDCIEPRTGMAVWISATLALAISVLLILSISGAVIALVFAAVEYAAMRRSHTILKGSALRIGPQQFPEIHACVSAYARRLSLVHVPEVYVLDAAEVNGFALRLGRKNGIFLTDEAVAGCLEGQSPGALAFVIAHEMAHIALGHQRWWRRTLAKLRWLSRLDECSADNVACGLVATREAAQDGVILLVSGPRLLSFVNREAARAQAAELTEDRAVRRVERTLTHHLSLHRLDRVTKRFEASRWNKAA